jgi:D-alanine transaminase
LEQHLGRLRNSLCAVAIPDPQSEGEWAAVLATLVQRNGGGDQALYIQVTRGVARRDHVPSGPMVPTVFAMCSRLELERDLGPVSAITCADIRWRYCNIKAISLLPNVLLRQKAAEQGAYEAILVRDGLIAEGAASNVFLVSAGIVKTPPKGSALLPGITRDLVIEVLAAAGVPCLEVEVPEAELARAEEIWLTSSVREILPVVQLNGCPVGTGRPGPMWGRCVEWYQAFKAQATAPLVEAVH